ncbi:hypothetical protein Y032_0006g2947 [Ancylostoma ceylanicum]|uniref:Uncharacterized protein n=1 Tax=Ancylostoma ceylanicum TaxID=53326 RepID=A0A016VRG5_9BILA|nr:hypothetical protein Y032_0006g2947 [Ancylostoma ceylanicum]
MELNPETLMLNRCIFVHRYKLKLALRRALMAMALSRPREARCATAPLMMMAVANLVFLVRCLSQLI